MKVFVPTLLKKMNKKVATYFKVRQCVYQDGRGLGRVWVCWRWVGERVCLPTGDSLLWCARCVRCPGGRRHQAGHTTVWRTVGTTAASYLCGSCYLRQTWWLHLSNKCLDTKVNFSPCWAVLSPVILTQGVLNPHKTSFIDKEKEIHSFRSFRRKNWLKFYVILCSATGYGFVWQY